MVALKRTKEIQDMALSLLASRSLAVLYLKYIGPTEHRGMKESCESGILAGYPVIDLKAALVMALTTIDSSEAKLSKLLAQWLS